MFADTLTLFEYLVKNSILQDQNGGPCALNQSAVYMGLFNQPFDVHDGLEDVKTLRRILFASRLNLSIRDLLNHDDTYDDSLYLSKRQDLIETFGSLLYDNSDVKSTIGKCMVKNDRRRWPELYKLEKHLREIRQKRTCSSVIHIAHCF